MKLNPREAPKGFRAVKRPIEGQCEGCDLWEGPCHNKHCLPHERKDEHSVIFKRIKKARKA